MGRQRLGELELLVMLAVLQLDEDEAHTLGILRAIHVRTGRPLERAAVYITLQRLEKKGLVASWLANPRPERGGKRRRHVRLLPEGLEKVRETRNALLNMWSGLESALEGS
ncbi:MAG: helix-turn-helix domain-containing protein [Thermoanaerobaculia bacterium]|nr:helix-turn-helix domain-containing protein [Thermoanaerobaculia bacterium]